MGCKWQKGGGGEKERERDRERQKETDRQTDRGVDRDEKDRMLHQEYFQDRTMMV